METATIETQTQDPRLQRGQNMIENGFEPIIINERVFNVPSQSGNGLYTVMKNHHGWICSCPDHSYRAVECKHIHAICFWLALRAKIEKSQVRVEHIGETIVCLFCSSPEVIKNGSRTTRLGRKNRYLCKTCGHTFSFMDEATGFNGMKFDANTVTMCLDMFFKGMSLRKIAQHIEQHHDIKLCHTTINYWTKKYTRIINDYVETLEPEVSDTWNVDEMQVKVKDGDRLQEGGKWSWLWNVMDKETRFLLASVITKGTGRSVDVAVKPFQESKKMTKKDPREIITDGLPSYPAAISQEYQSNGVTKHSNYPGLTARKNNNRVENLHGNIRAREKTLRGMEDTETAQALIDGLRHHHNFINPNEGLKGRTPAQAASLELDLGKNKWLGLIQKGVEHQKANGTQ